MSEIIPFDNTEKAFEFLKKKLVKKGYKVNNLSPIDYGIQFMVFINEKPYLIRIYSGKKGTKLDISQTKNVVLEREIRDIFGLSKLSASDAMVITTVGKTYSLCVGINSFSDANFVTLDYASNDAKELNQLFVEKFGVGEGTIRLLNEEATLREIIRSINKLKEIAKPEDTIVIFFATHGEYNKNDEGGDFYLITSDSEYDKLIVSGLSMNILKKLIKEIPAKKKVIFIDTCYSAGICRREKSEISVTEKERIFQRFASEDFIIITSCLEHENSHESSEFKHGVFSYYLLSGLTGAVEVKDNEVDLYTLFIYINKYVKKYVSDEKGRNQTPKFFGNLEGPFGLPQLKESKVMTRKDLSEYQKKSLDNDSVKLKFETINCIGIDESGKGDYFGPLVVAAVYVNDENKMDDLKAIGVRDCKKLPDSRVKVMAKRVSQLCDSEVIRILPPKYNELYARMGNLNEILAWAHSQSLEQVLKRNPKCEIAISDQFAWKDILLGKLKQMGRKIQVIQRPKAEENIAVAAASILARAKFVETIEYMNRTFRHSFSKGANDKVILEAVEYVKKKGGLQRADMVLSNVAKVHFKTTDQVKKMLSS